MATYGYRCANGALSIWSLRQVENGEVKSLVTIELTAQERITFFV